MTWRKSSFSGSGGNCVEVRWRKSSASNDVNCVEVRHDLAAVRDSKNPTGPTLSVDLARLAAVLRAGGPGR
ncbi:DUF397 domain-containing protein [Actinokineospora bangkokensis]|uniref:DUF397 domain-containing protein n=1 Tax=Actinokineospora bangkokensis TaxID=1193682 RepID=A0A1Q9LGZ2_9PSEU|nr:DUF397 domain-containing protein [Actinokineospora bangkokensis]OLR91312.1 hypothetical protein BJP25_26980 [Actinokineospora bangkokensis]